jgi:hypothetical protein
MTGAIDDSPSVASPAPPDVVTVKQSRSQREGRPSHIEVSPQRIRYVAGTGESRPDVMRNRGDEVMIYARQSGRIGSLYLEQRGTTISWSLPLFSRKSVGLACRSQGWRVVNTRRRVSPVS